MMLTVELNPKNQSVEIHCDQAGIGRLIHLLERLRHTGGHLHLMTPSWAGTELSEEVQGADNTLVHHLEIFLWREDST